jgi:hypothetical protein
MIILTALHIIDVANTASVPPLNIVFARMQSPYPAFLPHLKLHRSPKGSYRSSKTILLAQVQSYLLV